MKSSNSLEFWNEIGPQKNFSDPFFIDKLLPCLSKEKLIVEYGCGYGRILNLLRGQGFEKLYGFDFAPKMIERGQKMYPDLDLQVIEQSGKIPLSEQTANIVILSTVLCCNPLRSDQEKIINEIQRVLVKGGVLYLYDFLITQSERYLPLYSEWAQFGEEDYGIYKNSQNVFFRHHSIQWIFDLLKKFDILWLEQMNHITMNSNPVRTCHLIAQKWD